MYIIKINISKRYVQSEFQSFVTEVCAVVLFFTKYTELKSKISKHSSYQGISDGNLHTLTYETHMVFAYSSEFGYRNYLNWIWWNATVCTWLGVVLIKIIRSRYRRRAKGMWGMISIQQVSMVFSHLLQNLFTFSVLMWFRG